MWGAEAGVDDGEVRRERRSDPPDRDAQLGAAESDDHVRHRADRVGASHAGRRIPRARLPTARDRLIP